MKQIFASLNYVISSIYSQAGIWHDINLVIFFRIEALLVLIEPNFFVEKYDIEKEEAVSTNIVMMRGVPNNKN